MNSQQLGKFNLKEEIVRSHPEDVARAFADMEFVAVHTDLDFVGNMHYRGISSKFKEIEKGYVMPEYKVEILWHQLEGGKTVYSHVEVTKI